MEFFFFSFSSVPPFFFLLLRLSFRGACLRGFAHGRGKRTRWTGTCIHRQVLEYALMRVSCWLPSGISSLPSFDVGCSSVSWNCFSCCGRFHSLPALFVSVRIPRLCLCVCVLVCSGDVRGAFMLSLDRVLERFCLCSASHLNTRSETTRSWEETQQVQWPVRPVSLLDFPYILSEGTHS